MERGERDHADERKLVESEIPRPSSRETAKPPCWESDRGGTVAIQPSVQRNSPLILCAERAEAGPGPGAACRQNRLDTGTGPRGDIASHFVGLSVFTFSHTNIGRDHAQFRRWCRADQEPEKL